MENLPAGVSDAQFCHLLTLADDQSKPEFLKAQAVFSYLLSLYARDQQDMALTDEYKDVYAEGIEFIQQLLLIGCL